RLQGAADGGDGAMAVLGEGLDEDRDATGPVALVGHLVIGDALELPRAFLDRPLDVVGRHAVLPGRLHRGPEARVGVDVATAHAGGDGYLLDQLGEQLPAPGILESLLVFDRAPLGMAGHGTCSSLPPGPGSRSE